ncbi:hypothetical protein L9F63_026250, partial [Diploptera punctata]
KPHPFKYTGSIFALALCVVDAKFCAFELHGERRYYTCPRNEYCCNFGCCVSPAFQFYQLWYYWLLVIFMFLLCSGGGWWYRYWLQSRYRTVLPVTNSNSRHSRVPTRTSSQPRRPRPRVARVSYNPSRDAVVLHRIWKGPRNCPPPSYNSTQGELSTDSNNQSRISGQECPYYQLYGPPPSYDSPTQIETTNATSTGGDVANNVITCQETAGSSHHDDNSPLERTSDKSSITSNPVHTAQAEFFPQEAPYSRTTRTSFSIHQQHVRHLIPRETQR